MTSKNQRVANGKNARRSTGPKTHKGKRTASLNSLKHGLSVDESGSWFRAKQTAELAAAIAGSSADPFVQEKAIAIARYESRLHLLRWFRVMKVASSNGYVFPPFWHLSEAVEKYERQIAAVNFIAELKRAIEAKRGQSQAAAGSDLEASSPEDAQGMTTEELCTFTSKMHRLMKRIVKPIKQMERKSDRPVERDFKELVRLEKYDARAAAGRNRAVRDLFVHLTLGRLTTFSR